MGCGHEGKGDIGSARILIWITRWWVELGWGFYRRLAGVVYMMSLGWDMMNLSDLQNLSSSPHNFCKSQLCFYLYSQPCGQRMERWLYLWNLVSPSVPWNTTCDPAIWEKGKRHTLPAPALSPGPKKSEGTCDTPLATPFMWTEPH